SHELVKIFKGVTKEDAKMWGPSIIGFGSYHYKYESGHEGDMPLAAFSPRKSEMVLYLDLDDKRDEFLKKFGKHKPSKGCVYFKKLADVDVNVLKKMVVYSIKSVKK